MDSHSNTNTLKTCNYTTIKDGLNRIVSLVIIRFCVILIFETFYYANFLNEPHAFPFINKSSGRKQKYFLQFLKQNKSFYSTVFASGGTNVKY